MKKSLLIMMLCAVLCACAGSPGVVSEEDALLTYADLANEITVGYENIARSQADSRTTTEPVDTP